MQLLLTTVADVFNPIVGDLYLTPDGQMVFTSDLATEVAQEIRQVLNFFQGEWFLDQNEGMPYFESILVKNPDLQAIKGIFRKALLDVNHVERVNEMDIVLDDQTRVAQVNFIVQLSTGDTLDSSQFQPFVVTF